MDDIIEIDVTPNKYSGTKRKRIEIHFLSFIIALTKLLQKYDKTVIK